MKKLKPVIAPHIIEALCNNSTPIPAPEEPMNRQELPPQPEPHPELKDKKSRWQRLVDWFKDAQPVIQTLSGFLRAVAYVRTAFQGFNVTELLQSITSLFKNPLGKCFA